MQNSPTAVYPHNIHHELSEVVQRVRKESIGSTLVTIVVLTLLGSVFVSLVPGIPLGLLAVVAVLGALAWQHVERETLPRQRLSDAHLALLAEIGFNAREAGQRLQSRLEEKGYLTYRDLRKAQMEYDQDNTREYSLRSPGAQAFLGKSSMST
jgi:hypothetical protein